ncbi:MAG: DUF262 domain-containing protein [Clostridium sp.]
MSLRELEISNIAEIFKLALKIPEYQRPYKWSGSSTNRLFSDIYKAYESNLEEYRIGAIILHNKESQDYNIVDGQQRITTIAILDYILSGENDFLKIKYNKFSEKAIMETYRILRQRVSELDEKEEYRKYLLEKCTVVKIVTDNEQEAFQFFDSQNSRGKSLEPHDLLKSYHLREMHSETNSLKLKIIKEWEKRDDLNELFEKNLYPLIKWYKGKYGLKYSMKEIHEFKGIKSSNKYNYGVRVKATNLAIEKINGDGVLEILGKEEVSQFQLTEKLIAGKRFFLYVYHYGKLKDEVEEKIEKFLNKNHISLEKRQGDVYVKELYVNVVIFAADRFGIKVIDEAILKKIFLWAYSIRLVMRLVYKETINKYALGNHERVKNGNIFEMINEMESPKEINLIRLGEIEKYDKKNEKVEEIFREVGLIVNEV